MGRRTGILAALSALLTGCSATGFINALVPGDTYAGREGIAYGPLPRQKLDIYQPIGSNGPVPVVVFFYGGNWRTGERADYRFVGEALASNGYLVAIPDYRLVPEGRYPVFLDDSAAAARWVFENAAQYGGDVTRIHLMGHSAGAYNAAMLALDPRWLRGLQAKVAGLIGLAGPYDFLPIQNPDTRNAFNWPDTPADSQPMAHVSSNAPRTLLLAAAKDKLVDPQRNSVALARRLKAVGVDARSKVMDGVSHVTIAGALAKPLRRLAPVLDEVLGFLAGR